MPRHTETRALPFAPADMFDLVADIERYPEFLPWCTAARIRDREPGGLLADLEIGYRMFVETFTSRVTLRRPGAIDVVCERGPFRHLRNAWRFAPAGEGACELRFEIDFAFRSRILEHMIGRVFDRAFGHMVESFERRAASLYAKSSPAAA